MDNRHYAKLVNCCLRLWVNNRWSNAIYGPEYQMNYKIRQVWWRSSKKRGKFVEKITPIEFTQYRLLLASGKREICYVLLVSNDHEK